jgi:HEAT repeat protein
MLLSGNRGRINKAAAQIAAAGLADAYAALLLLARRREAQRERRLFRLVAVNLPYTERERRSALTALGLLWGPLGRELGIALDPKASHFDREHAHNALMRRRDQRAVQPLIDALLTGHALEDWRCVSTLGTLGDRRATDGLLRYMGLVDDSAPAAGVRDVGLEVGRALRVLNARAALQLARESLQSPSPDRRAGAALVLAGWNDEELNLLLLPLAGDESPVVRAAAVMALGELKVAAAFGVLQASLADADVEVRAAAERAVQQLTTAHPKHILKAASRGLVPSYGRD